MEHAFQIYKFSRTKIQMKAVNLEESNIFKRVEQVKGKYITGIQFGTRVEATNGRLAYAYLKATVELKDIETKDIAVGIDVVYKGRFETMEEINVEELKKWVDIQVVPQLLPYVRSYVTNTTSAMGIPPINIPTMDILETIKGNDHHGLGEGVGNDAH